MKHLPLIAILAIAVLGLTGCNRETPASDASAPQVFWHVQDAKAVSLDIQHMAKNRPTIAPHANEATMSFYIDDVNMQYASREDYATKIENCVRLTVNKLTGKQVVFSKDAMNRIVLSGDVREFSCTITIADRTIVHGPTAPISTHERFSFSEKTPDMAIVHYVWTCLTQHMLRHPDVAK